MFLFCYSNLPQTQYRVNSAPNTVVRVIADPWLEAQGLPKGPATVGSLCRNGAACPHWSEPL